MSDAVRHRAAEAIAVLAAAGWSEKDIAAALRLSVDAVCGILGIRPGERRSVPLMGRCCHREGEGWCDQPVAAGNVLCAKHRRPPFRAASASR